MGAQLRALRSRIRSIKSTAKITRAQELIAAARINRAQQRLLAARPYAREITQAVSALITHNVHLDHPLLHEDIDGSRIAALLITSDRGFCGAYNNNVLRRGDALALKIHEEGGEPVYFVSGRKGVGHFEFRDQPMAGHWSGLSGQPTYEMAAEIGGRLVEAFRRPNEDGGVGAVHVIYTEFASMLTQRPVVRRILPLVIEEVEAGEAAGVPPDYEFEPSPTLVLDDLLRRYVHGAIWHVLLESAASEHAARRAAMMSATDNAAELIERLSREANEARQDEITMELSEITAGANALGGEELG